MSEEPFWIGMDVGTISYAAGLFDGEGSIHIKGPTPRGRSHQVRISLSMTHEPTVQWMADIFGGRCRRVLAPSAVALGRRPKFVWSANSGRAEAFLRVVRPWLKTKAEAADLALELQARLVYQGAGLGRLTDAEIAVREGIRMRLRQLNTGHRANHVRETAYDPTFGP